MCRAGVLNCIVPPHILKKLLDSDKRHVREIALKTLLASARLRTQRQFNSFLPSLSMTSAGEKRRTIYDAQHREIESGVLVRGENDPAVADEPVNQAYDGLGATYDFFMQVFERNSIDDHGMRLDGIVHYGDSFNNAFWNGRAMVFGDGDEDVFTGFTKSIDVIAHELTHGITEFSAGLEYHNQSGALNESFSDVFGSLVKQWLRNEVAEDADWLIGNDIFTPGIDGDALRSMKDPGSAYDGDPQPKHMDRFQTLPDNQWGDWGGVHINSGIPNHAFYRLAIALGGHAWGDAGKIWYESLKRLWPDAQFQDCADMTHTVAGDLFAIGSTQQDAVRDAWSGVGIRVTGATPAAAPTKRIPTKVGSRQPDVIASKSGKVRTANQSAAELEELQKRLIKLEAQIEALTNGGR